MLYDDHISTQQELIEARVLEIVLNLKKEEDQTEEWQAVMIEFEARWIN